MNETLGRVVMVVPTYNEADNLAWLVGRLRAAQPDVDVLVVDDNSPDGTGRLAEELAAADSSVHVLHRPGKGGLGAAYLAGLHVGLYQGTAELSAQWRAERTFRPTLSPERAAEKMAAWEHAVRQTVAS